jgi:hypothetical protein
MRFGLYRTRKRRPGNEHGGGPVEFELRLQRFLWLILAIIDFDRLGYMRHVVSDPSRGGAHYGSRSHQSTNPFKKLNSFHSKYPLNNLVNLATTLAGIEPFFSLWLDPLLGSGKIAGCGP